jgi:hypothetical protein
MANGNWWDKYKTGGAAVASEEEEAEPVAQEGNWWDKYKSPPAPEPEAPLEPAPAESEPETAPQANWWDKYKTTATEPQQDPNKDLISNWDKTTKEFEEARRGYEQLGARYQELGAKEVRTPEEEQELQTTWNGLLNSGFSAQSAQDRVAELQPQIEKFNERQKKARIDYIEDRRGSGVFGDEAANALYDIDARAEEEYAQARTIEDTDKRKEAMAAIQAKYQAEEKDLTNQYVERFKEGETKINNGAEAIGQAFASGQSVDQFLLESNANAPEYDELRQSLINQDNPEQGRLFREARAMVDLAEGTNKVGIVNNEIRISPLHVWDAEGIKGEIDALDISDSKKRTAISAIPQLQKEAAKIEYPWLKENVSEFNSFVKDNNLENVSPERQIAEWKGRNDGWLSNIPKAGVQAVVGLRQQALGFLGAGQTIVGATASILGAQKFADPFLDAASKTSDEIDRLERISQEIGGPTLVKDLASGALQVGVQVGFGGAVGFGAKRAGFKPKTVSNIGFGSSVGAVMAQSYGGVLSSAIQTLEKEKIDGGMEPTQARAEAIKEAQLPAALSALIEGTVTILGGKRGSESPFREGPDAIKAKLNTPAYKAQLDRFMPNVIGGGTVEGVEELIAQIGQGFVEQATFNPNLTTSEIVNNGFKALIVGGMLGSGVEGLKYGFDYMKAPKAMARREASMASIRQSIADAEQDISNISASSPIGAEFQREYDATLPSDEAANLGGVAVDRTRMSALQSERQQISELLEDDTISRVARNQLEGKLAAADISYYNEVLAPMRRNVVNEQMVDQLDGMAVSQQTKDGITAMAKIANGLGAETLTGRERVAVGITSVGEGRFLPSIKNPMVEVNDAGQATVTEAGRLMAENVGMVPLVRMIGLSETTRAKQAEMERVVAEAEARKAQQEAKDTAESEDAKRYGPASAEALKQQVAVQPPAPEKESNARLAQLLKEQEEAARLGEEAVTRAVEARFIESFRSSIGEAIIPTAERAATIDLNNFRDVINSIAQEIEKGTFNIELVEQGEFKNILPEQAFTTVVEAFRENPQRAINALRTFGDEVENAVKEFGGGAAGEPVENLEPLLRVVRTEQTPEDVTALTEAGLIEIYKDQPVLTQAGIDTLPEAERPRLNPEARKIQIDTGANEVVAEAISKGLRIGVDQVGPNVTMPQGWTLDGDIYVPPAPPVEPPVVPPVTPPPVAPTVGTITEKQANNAIKVAQEERVTKPAPTIGRSRWGPQSIAPKQSIGKTVREALKTASRLNLSKIAQSDPNEIMMQDVAAILAELDMPILDLEPIKSLSSLRKKGRPRRWGGVNSVIGLPSTVPMPVEYLVHEAGHTITADQVRRYLPREKFARGKGYLDAINKVVADPKTPEPISRLFSLYVSTIEQLGIADQYFVAGGIAGGKSADASKALAQRAQAKGLIRGDIKPEDFYGLSNVEEFVSQTFSEQSFRDLLKSLKDPNNPRQSLWQAFVDAIQRVLQLPKGTMAAAVVEASIDVGMLVEPDRVRARGRGGVTPAPAPEPYPSIGININDAGQNFTEQIIAGDKTIETRDTDSLRPYVGKRVGIVRTGVGPATLVGYATIGEPVVYNSATEFRADQDKHLVAKGSQFDIKEGGVKYGYPLTDIEEVSPTPVTSQGIVARKIPQPEAEADAAPEPEEAPTGIVEGEEVQLEGGDLLRAMKTQSETQYAGKIGRISGKEIFQNSVDAIMKITPQQEAQRGVPKAIYVGTQSKFSRSEYSAPERIKIESRVGGSLPYDDGPTRGNDLVVYDTGTGMTPSIVIDKFLRAFVSGKTVGEGGGFGQAKLAFLGGSKYFKVATVAEDANGKKYVTILEGAGDSFYMFNLKPPKVVLRPMTKITLAAPTDGIPMTLEYFEVPADTITGTAIVSEIPEGGYNDGAGGGKGFISDVVKYVDGISFLDMDGAMTGNNPTFLSYPTTRNNPLEFLGFTTPDVSSLAPITMEFGLLKSVDLPSATIDFLARTNEAYGKTSYITAKILNRSIYQFDEDVFFNEEVALPREVVVNIKPKVEAGSKDYPFTTSRENLSGDVKQQVKEYFASVGKEAIKKLNEQFDTAKNSAIPIPNSKQTFLDVGQNNDAVTINSIASSPSTAAINEDIAFGQEQILRTLNTIYPNKFGRATFAGFITGGRSYGVHFGIPNSKDPSTIWHDPWLQLSLAKDSWARSGLADPSEDGDFDTATDKEINDFYDFYLRQSYGVSFHEALHQIVDEEGEGLARELTFRTGDLLYGFLTSSIPNNRTIDEKRAILKELETNGNTLAANVNQTIASQFITAQGGYSGYAFAERGRQETAKTEAGRVLPTEGDLAPDEEFEIVPEQVEDQIEGTPEASTIKVMGQAFQMADEQSAANGTPEGTLPMETIVGAWMGSGRDVETLENAIIRYTNLEPEVAATLAEAIGKQVEIQRGITEIADFASRRKAEKEDEPETKPYSFAERIKGELPPELRSKINLAYEVLRNEVSVQEANQAMSGLTVDEAIKATEDMNNGISMPVRSMMGQIVFRKILAQRKATKGKKGKEADYEAIKEAHVEFFNWFSEYSKELGQGVQAIARFSDLGADGILLKVRKDIDKAVSKHIKNRRGQIDQIKRDVEDADNAAFNAAIKSNKDNIDKTAKKAGEQEAKKMTIEEQAQKLAIRAAKKVEGEEVRRRQPDPLSDLVNGHLRRYNANFIAEATAMGVSPVTAQAIEDSAKKLRDSRQSAKAERERFKEMQDERMKVKKELARENKYIYGERPTIWEDYQQMFSERLARRLMRDPKKKVPPSLLLFTDRLTENLLGFVPEAQRQTTTQRSFQAIIEDALNNKEKYQEAFNRALEDISIKVMELEAKQGGGETVSSAAYKKAVAAQEFMERLEPIIQQFPVSDKLIMRFVNQKMKAMGESLVGRYNDWYRSSKKTRIEIEKALAEKLVADMNVSNADAINLSRAVIKDFRAKAEERREKALARFKKPKEKTKRLAESPLKKFFELVNIGVMTDKDAYEVMAHRFELPTWDAKFAKQIGDMALIVQDMPEGLARRRMTRNMMAEIARRKGFSLSDLGSGFFYSNMLSSIETFLINLNDTLLGNWVNGLASSVADKDFTRLNGLMVGYRKGWMEAINVFNTGLRINMPRLEEKTPLTVELTNYGRKGGVALESTEGMNAIAKTILESPPARVLNLWKYVTRIMEATDALNYTASAEGQRYAEAAKMAKDEGLEGNAKQKRINQILNLEDGAYQTALKQAEQEGYTGNDAKFRAMEVQDNKIDAGIRERGFDRALTDVYRNMPTGLAGFMAAKFNNIVMSISNPWFRNAFKLLSAPFVITPTNLFNRWLDYSPYGFKRLFYGSGNLLDKDTPYYVAPPKAGSAEFYTQALKASSSVMVMGLAYGLVKAGLLTLRGMGPSDEEERKTWIDDNNRPHTFSFMGGPQISYQFSPWALVLSWMANSMNWEQYNAKPEAGGLERGFVGMKFAVGVIMDLPFFAGPAEFMDVIQKTRGDAVATPLKYVEGKMGMVYPNLVRQIDRFFDPTIYDSQGLKGVIIDQMPFARRLGTQRVNLFGDPIGEDKPTMDRLIGRIISFPTNPSRESLILAKYDIYPYMPSPQRAKALVDGEQAQMTEEQYNKFVQIVGKDVKQRINDLFDPEGEITEQERERGKKRISKIFERARARGVREVSTY